MSEQPPRRARHQRHSRVELQHEDRQKRRAERAGEQRVRQHPQEAHQVEVYTSAVPCDVDAAVMSNTRLSDDYSVLALAAPEIAALAQPGQFVMVKPSRGNDPLLRRPFSDLRNPARRRRRADRHLDSQQAHRRRHEPPLRRGAGRAHRLPRSARPAVRAGRTAAAGVDGRRRRRPGAVRHARGSAARARNTPATLFYGARRGARSVLRRPVRAARRAHRRRDRRRQPRREGIRHRAARRRARGAAAGRATSSSTSAGRRR